MKPISKRHNLAMEDACNSFHSRRKCSVVFESAFIKKDKTFKLNFSLLGNRQELDGNWKASTREEDTQRHLKRLKTNFGFELDVGSSGGHRPSSFQNESLGKNRCFILGLAQTRKTHFPHQDGLSGNRKDRRFVCGTTQIRETSDQDRSHGKNKYRRFVPKTPRHDMESSDQDGSSGKKIDHELDLDSAQSRDLESSNQGGSSGENKDHLLDLNSAQSRDLESSNQGGSSGENKDDDSAPRSDQDCRKLDGSPKKYYNLRFRRSLPQSGESLPSNQDKQDDGSGLGSSRSQEADPSSNSTDQGFPTHNPSSSSSTSEWEQPRKIPGTSSSKPKTKRRKSHHCGLCKKIFVHKADCESHRRTHTGERPFQCRGCGMTFTSDQLMKKHWDTHRPHIMVQCETCGKSFRTKRSLRDHAKVHRQVSGPFSCLSCGRQFSRKYHLNRHHKDHPDHLDVPLGC